MRLPRHIRVFPQDIKPGAEYKGYVCGNSTHFWRKIFSGGGITH